MSAEETIWEDAALGPLRFQSDRQAWESIAPVRLPLGSDDGVSVVVSVGGGRAADRTVFTRAAERCRHPELARAPIRAAEAFFDLYDRVWRRPEDPVLTPESFADRLVVTAVEVDDEGGVAVQLDAGDLFGDHGIQVSYDARFTLLDVGLA